MPKRKKAKWGHRGRDLFTNDDGIRAYTDEAISKLAETYGVSGDEKIAKLKERLEGAGVIYRTWKMNHNDAPRPGEMKAALDEIQGLAEKLRGRLDQLDDMTADFYWQPESFLIMKVSDPNFIKSKYGHTISRVFDNEGRQSVTFLNSDNLFEALDILGNYAKDAKQLLPSDRGGPREDEALRMWAINAAMIWEEVVGRKFTRDEEKGLPVSEAANFCVEAFLVIEPGTPETRVLDAMKKVQTGK